MKKWSRERKNIAIPSSHHCGQQGHSPRRNPGKRCISCPYGSLLDTRKSQSRRHLLLRIGYSFQGRGATSFPSFHTFLSHVPKAEEHADEYWSMFSGAKGECSILTTSATAMHKITWLFKEMWCLYVPVMNWSSRITRTTGYASGLGWLFIT